MWGQLSSLAACTNPKNRGSHVVDGTVNIFQFGADSWAQQQQTGPSQENIPHPEAKLQDLFCFKFCFIALCSKKFLQRKEIARVPYFSLNISVAYKY